MLFSVGDGTVAVNVPTKDVLLSEVAARFRHRRGFAIATLNLDHLVKLNSEKFMRAYGAQDFVTADGNPIVWMSRIARTPVDLVTGADLVVPLAQLAAREQVRVGLFGSDEATLQSASTKLMADIPGLDIALTLAPPMGFAPDGSGAEAAVAAFRAAGVQMVFIALGAPKQEIFAALGRRIAPEMGFASIGAGLDFIAGTQNRAPVWARQLAMEWLWRMISNPRRLAKRYGQCLVVLPRHLVDAVGQRHQAGMASTLKP